MINHLEWIPPYDFQTVWAMPWTDGFSSYGWVMLMGFLVGSACALLGVFLALRRMALVGDAISHSVLPGIVLAFLITGLRSSGSMLLGALVAGVAAALLIEFLGQKSSLRLDAALAVVFSTAFALGVLLIALFADHVDLDLDCVLFGEIAFIPLAASINWLGIAIPVPILQMGGIFLLELILIGLFFKELLISTFDPSLARLQGIPLKAIHYGLIILLSLAVVAAFEAVGVILVVAMMILPFATARFWVKSLRALLIAVVFLSAFYSTLGLHLALFSDSSVAACMAVVAFFLFLISWGGAFLSISVLKKNNSPI